MLNERQRAYLEHGFVRLPRVLEENDLAVIRSEWSRLWRENGDAHPSVQWRGHDALHAVPDRIDPPFLMSRALHDLCNDRRLTTLAAQWLGAPVVMFKDKLISKAPGTQGYGLHQDWQYWTKYGVPADRMTTMMIALDPCDAASGALEVWPAASGPLPAPADEPRDVDPAALDLSRGTLVPLDPGDALLLHPLAPHRSAANTSANQRRAYFVSYITAEYASAAERYKTELREILKIAEPCSAP
jgi:ectoine hydroxylase-related dioxygenase (phytanoyl-CoA dioxygenase family)